MHMLLAGLTLAVALAAQPASPPDDATLWTHFEEWVAQLPMLPPGERVSMRDRYVDALVADGVAKEAATARYARIETIRRSSTAKELVYWNAAFKSGGGPDAPLRLLQETVQHLKPGRALDAGMGRGRNAIFLASLGWDVTGYDIAADALTSAQAHASRAGVTIRTQEASHDTFDCGASQWDLIVCAYCYMRIQDTHPTQLLQNGVWSASRSDSNSTHPRPARLLEQGVRRRQGPAAEGGRATARGRRTGPHARHRARPRHGRGSQRPPPRRAGLDRDGRRSRRTSPSHRPSRRHAPAASRSTASSRTWTPTTWAPRSGTSSRPSTCTRGTAAPRRMYRPASWVRSSPAACSSSKASPTPPNQLGFVPVTLTEAFGRLRILRNERVVDTAAWYVEEKAPLVRFVAEKPR